MKYVFVFLITLSLRSYSDDILYIAESMKKYEDFVLLRIDKGEAIYIGDTSKAEECFKTYKALVLQNVKGEFQKKWITFSSERNLVIGEEYLAYFDKEQGYKRTYFSAARTVEWKEYCTEQSAEYFFGKNELRLVDGDSDLIEDVGLSMVFSDEVIEERGQKWIALDYFMDIIKHLPQ